MKLYSLLLLGLLAVPTSAQEPASQPEPTEEQAQALEHFDQGFRLMQQGLYDEALAEYRKAVELFPTLGVAYAEMAVVLAMKEQWAEADAMLEKAFSLDGNNPGVWVTAGTVHSMKGDTAEAIEDYERAISLNPIQPDARDNLGRYYLDKGNAGLAMVHFGVLIEAHPDMPAGYIGAGLAQTQLGEAEGARKQCQATLKLIPNFVEYLADRAFRLSQASQLEQAVLHAHAAVITAPRDADAWDRYGALLAANGQILAGIEQHRKAIELDPTFSRAYNNLGNGLEQLGKLDEAVTAYEKAVELAPNYAFPLHNLGHIYFNRDEYQMALTKFQAAFALEPNNTELVVDLSDSHINVGFTLMQRGALKEAERHFRKSLEVEAGNASGLAGMCLVSFSNGEYAAALEFSKQSLAKSADYDWAHACRAQVLTQMGDAPGAMAAWERAVEADSTNGHMVMGYAIALLAAGDENGPLEMFCEAQRLHDHYSDKRRLRGERLILHSPETMEMAMTLIESMDREGCSDPSN